MQSGAHERLTARGQSCRTRGLTVPQPRKSTTTVVFSAGRVAICVTLDFDAVICHRRGNVRTGRYIVEKWWFRRGVIPWLPNQWPPTRTTRKYWTGEQGAPRQRTNEECSDSRSLTHSQCSRLVNQASDWLPLPRQDLAQHWAGRRLPERRDPAVIAEWAPDRSNPAEELA